MISPPSDALRSWVALRKESVDRNSADFVEIDDFKVALRKESVDRNGFAMR